MNNLSGKPQVMKKVTVETFGEVYDEVVKC